MSGPLFVICHFLIPAPKAAKHNRRKLLHNTPHFKKPDADNLEKFLNDSLRGIVWEDDSRIAWLLRSKSLTSDKVGSTVIFVREMTLGQPDYEQILSDIQEHIELEAPNEKA